MAQLVKDCVPSVEKVRMTNSGTEACMSAIRVARGFTDRPKIIKFDGCYHGHADSLPFTQLPEATFKVDGHLPKNLTVTQAAKRIGAYQLPAVWFPYRKMGMSTTDILADSTKGKFGPFAGQLFCGEFTMSFVSRVFLEKVGGEYQGACFRFREGLDCAALRLKWGAIPAAQLK